MSLRFALDRHARFRALRQRLQTVQSSATWRTASGRCTFTATASPAHVSALYTWPRLAAATGREEKDANRGDAVGSEHADAKRGPGAKGPRWFRSSAMARCATSSGKGSFSHCKDLSASAASSPMRSARCERVCPIFTNTGPRPASASRRTAARRRSSGGSDSSRRHARITPANTFRTTARRAATTPGRRLKKRKSFALSNSPRSWSYGEDARDRVRAFAGDASAASVVFFAFSARRRSFASAL